MRILLLTKNPFSDLGNEIDEICDEYWDSFEVESERDLYTAMLKYKDSPIVIAGYEESVPMVARGKTENPIIYYSQKQPKDQIHLEDKGITVCTTGFHFYFELGKLTQR